MHVTELIRSQGAAAQVCAIRDGETIMDESFDCRGDDVFLLFSAGKPFIAVLVHLLAQRGMVDLDQPVATYWPRFSAHGKAGVTVRQVLRHRSGVPVARGLWRDAVAATDWERSVRALESARPRYRAGTVPAYHVLSYGFILGELVQRVTGADLRAVLQAELLDPLGLQDTYLGLPQEQWARHVPIRATRLHGSFRARIFNRRAVRQAVVPAATVHSTARDLARFYQLLLEGAVLRPETLGQATSPSSDGQTDRVLGLPIRWSEGFQLGGGDRSRSLPMGRTSSENAFGHNGSNCCIGWADPDQKLAFAYLTNRLAPGLEASPHLSQISDAVRELSAPPVRNSTGGHRCQ